MRKFLLAAVVAAAPAFSPQPSPFPSPTPVPFWKAKTEIYDRMKERRYIAVSAKTESDGESKKLTVMAAGIIHAPESFAHGLIMKFSEYPKYVPYIEEASFDETTKDMFLHGAVLGYHVRMTLHTRDEAVADGHHLEWTSIGGSFVGMTGAIDEKAIDGEHTEISMNGFFKGPTLGIPTFLLNWGLEFAAQRASGAMRSHIESEWENSKKH